MSFVANLVINALTITMLVIVLSRTILRSNRTSLTYHIFNAIVIVTITLLISDTIGRMDGATEFSVPIANHLGNFLLFVLNPVPALLWILFVIGHVYEDGKILKKTMIPIASYFLLHLLGVILNLFFHFYYYIDANNVYIRGPLFLITVGIALLPLIFAFILTIKHRHKIDSKKIITLLLYPVIPLIGTTVMAFIYGYSIILPAIALGELLVFVGIQDDLMIIDYLTGAYNRRALEDFLRKKINDNNPKFAGIMLDIDHYKQINDTYGHLMGDQALIAFVKIVHESIHINDFVARYGGDEFFLVIDTDNIAIIENVLKRLQNNIDRFNDKNVYPFKFGFSKGYALYPKDDPIPMEQFINQLDMAMYQEKREKSN